MRILSSLSLALLLVSCGGPTTPAPPPPTPPKPAEPSGLSVVVDAADSYEAKGDAYAQYDPEQQMLAVFVFAPDTSPKPSCDELSVESLNLSAGGFAAIRLRGFTDKKPGTYPITGGGFIAGDVHSHGTRMASSGPESSSLVITTYDEGKLVATAESAPNAEMQIHGAFTATVCPDGALGTAGQVTPTPVIDLDAGAPEDAGPPPKKSKTKKKKKHSH
ncbi:MAG TPA: hypothetical protein VF407_16940 [Polyangiaceae bacterium]